MKLSFKDMLITHTHTHTIVWNCWHGHRCCQSSAGDICEEGNYDKLTVMTLDKQHTHTCPGMLLQRAQEFGKLENVWLAIRHCRSGQKKVVAIHIHQTQWLHVKSRRCWVYFTSFNAPNLQRKVTKTYCKLILDVKTYGSDKIGL